MSERLTIAVRLTLAELAAAHVGATALELAGGPVATRHDAALTTLRGKLAEAQLDLRRRERSAAFGECAP